MRKAYQAQNFYSKVEIVLLLLLLRRRSSTSLTTCSELKGGKKARRRCKRYPATVKKKNAKCARKRKRSSARNIYHIETRRVDMRAQVISRGILCMYMYIEALG